MLDTVRIATSRQLKPAIAAALNTAGCCHDSSSGWQFTTITKPDRHSHSPVRRFEGKHKTNEVYIWGEADTVKGASVSLPYLLHGFNGYQLKPGEINEAFQQLNLLLDVISTASVAIRDFFRVDLCLNIPCDVGTVLAAHGNARHPRIHRDTERYKNSNAHRKIQLNTVRLFGKRLNIQLYNKLAKLRPQGCNDATFIRAEVQLKDRKLVRELFGIPDGALFQSIDYVDAYRVFREIMCQFDVKKCDLPAFGFLQLLALCENGGFHLPDGRSAVEWYRSTVAAETYRKTLKEIQRCQFKLRDFSWAELLPEYGPPATVDLAPNGKLIHVPPPFRNPHDSAHP